MPSQPGRNENDKSKMDRSKPLRGDVAKKDAAREFGGVTGLRLITVSSGLELKKLLEGWSGCGS